MKNINDYNKFLNESEGKSDEQMMWEILVPVKDNSGNKFPLSYHNEWDNFVENLTGGLTVMRPAKGRWISPIGTKVHEKMIPCRIRCSEEDINKIVDFTIKHYNQEAVAYYLVSPRFIIKYKK